MSGCVTGVVPGSMEAATPASYAETHCAAVTGRDIVLFAPSLELLQKMNLAYDPVLPWSRELSGKKCERFTEFGEPAQNIIKRLKATMFYLNGQGLAAPQIGIFQEAILTYWQDVITPMFNPEVVDSSGSDFAWEACLSLPGATSRFQLVHNQARVRRPTWVRVKFQDADGEERLEEYSDWPARQVQHEIDHLDGIFFIDRVGMVSRNMVLSKFAHWMEGVKAGRI